MAATIQTIEKPKKARALDTSGNNNHGQIYSGRALEFDGVTDTLTSGTTATALGITSNITVACWVNVKDQSAGSSGTNGVIWNIYQDTDNGWGLRVNNSQQLHIYDDTNATDQSIYAGSTTDIQLNTWVRAVVVLDDNEQKLYINGVLVGSGTDILDHWTAGGWTSNIYLGARLHDSGTSYNQHYEGMISDFQIWNSAWTADDVLYDYNNPEQLALNRGGTSLTNSNLKLWYPMNDGHRGQQSYILDASNTGLGDELVSNGDFSNGTTNWSGFGSGGWSIVDGKATRASGESSNTQVIYNGSESITSGVTYYYSYDYNITSGNFTAYLGGVGAMGGGANLSGSGNASGYLTTSSTVKFNFYGLTSATGTIDNVSIKPINDKNHATTVFLGDEQISATNDRTFAGASNWTNSAGANAFNAYDETTNGQLTVTPDDVSDIQFAYLDGANWEDADGDGPAMVEGRTYRLSYDIHISAYTKGTLSVGMSNDATPGVMNVANTYTATNGSGATATLDFVYAAADHERIGIHAAANTVLTADFDNFSIKEVGTASGWTDADQQPDIPQIGLQSYNQLGWHDGADDSDDKEVKTNAYGGNFGTNDFVLSYCIFKNDSVGTTFFFLNSGSGTSGRYGHKIEANGDLQNYATDDANTSTGYFDVASGVIQTGKWHHIVESIDRSDNEVTVWVDGQSYGSTSISATGTISTSSNISAGGPISFLNFSTSNFINGTMNEISIWKNTEFTQSDVDELYNNGKILDARKHSKEVNSSKLANYWTNDGLTLWQDKKGSAHVTTNDLTETMVVTEGADNSRDSQGFLMNRERNTNSFNNDYQENTATIGGIGHYVDVPGFNFHATVFSISCWIKSYTMGTNETILDKYYNTQNQRAVRLYITTSGELQLQVSDDGSSNESQKTTDANLVVDTWYHIVVTYSSGTFTAYRNGTALSVDANFGTETSIDQNPAALRIGMSQDTKGSFNGKIDDLCIYDNKVLTAAEVTRNYNAGKRSHR